ncbi:hypothetical protein [Asticcacaulis endophyticus]|uniref:Uncharacterized protein n=1 Tax=Asticcacaulis endophyticus TaxID=1395890 RepID=A0A918Q3X4_9CAUL|nr:hypothetical protein [Asticcacaulis endophyticus]GGZ32761.1 hypothetical protein GCM10011273_18740 [Asticcacaulis endophyticus]
MADYYTQFACKLELGSSENVRCAMALYHEMTTELSDDGRDIGFKMKIGSDGLCTWLSIYDDISGNPENVIDFVRRCARALPLTGLWGFEWANTCSKSRLDAFGGGAHVLTLATGETVAWIDTHLWLQQHLDTT